LIDPRGPPVSEQVAEPLGGVENRDLELDEVIPREAGLHGADRASATEYGG
jgi:hypothetical protein